MNISNNNRKLVESYSHIYSTDQVLSVDSLGLNTAGQAEINESKLNSFQLNCETELNTNKTFQVKKRPNPKLRADFTDFKMKHCSKVRSILFSGHKYSSVYHPKDDSHAFYIVRNKKGIFHTRAGDKNKNETVQARKMALMQEETDKFIKKLNSLINVSKIRDELKQYLLIKIFFYSLICVCIGIISYLFLLFLLHLLSFLFIGHNFSANDSNFIQRIFQALLFVSACSGVYLNYRVIKLYRAKEKYLIFTHIFNKKNGLENEIDNWNSSVFSPHNMKCSLSQTLDYVQVFFDKEIVYEIEDHQFE